MVTFAENFSGSTAGSCTVGHHMYDMFCSPSDSLFLSMSSAMNYACLVSPEVSVPPISMAPSGVTAK